jgi:hypothetical protein
LLETGDGAGETLWSYEDRVIVHCFKFAKYIMMVTYYKGAGHGDDKSSFWTI